MGQLTRSTAAVAALLAVALSARPARADDGSDERERVQEATEILRELTGADDDDIPRHILERAEAVVVIPSLLKGGFVVGAQHGRGILSVRDRGTNTWSAPAFVAMTGGTFGLQIGAQAIDLVLLVMNRDGIDELLKDEFTLGGSASVAAGPVGRSAKAATDALMTAKILAYSRARGVFAGATLEGSSLRADDDANEEFYGRELETRAIVIDNAVAQAPPVVGTWRTTLAGVTTPSPESN